MSLPNLLAGLPSGTGLLNSAVAERVMLNGFDAKILRSIGVQARRSYPYPRADDVGVDQVPPPAT